MGPAGGDDLKRKPLGGAGAGNRIVGSVQHRRVACREHDLQALRRQYSPTIRHHLGAGIRGLREAVEHATAAARADAAPVNTSAPSDAQQPQLITPAGHDTSLVMNDSLWRIENLHARLTELALLLRGHPRLRTAVH